METPITVIGWEQAPKEKGGFNIRIYGTRQIVPAEGFECEGTEAVRLYFNPEYCKYQPTIGDVIIAIEGRYGIDRIVKIA